MCGVARTTRADQTPGRTNTYLTASENLLCRSVFEANSPLLTQSTDFRKTSIEGDRNSGCLGIPSPFEFTQPSTKLMHGETARFYRGLMNSPFSLTMLTEMVAV